MLSAESLLAKPTAEEREKFQNARARHNAHINSSIMDELLCGCGPALSNAVTNSNGDVYNGEYDFPGEKVKVSILKSSEFTRILNGSKYKVSELVERALLTHLGYKND